MKKQIKIPLVAIILAFILIIAVVVLLIVNGSKKPDEKEVTNNVNTQNIISNEVLNEQIEETTSISVVPTMKDRLTTDSAWCGTFQLVWNDLKNEIAGQDIKFAEDMEEVNNLNLGEFNTNMISEEYYYKKYGVKTLELKEEIENGIYEKFGQTSDILDSFDWSEDALNGTDGNLNRYFLYSMLYRKFEFNTKFDKLENGNFGDKYQNVQYFGINSNTDNSARNQVQVLYYNSEDDFAVMINTKSGDNLILCKNPEGNSFNDILNNMKNKSSNYTDSKEFNDIDELKIPYISFDITKEYEELENRPFETIRDGVRRVARIQKAIQSIKFSIDENGGEIKSEAGMDIVETTAMVEPQIETPRYFNFDDTFAMFLVEEDREMPYFAARIEDISKYQTLN